MASERTEEPTPKRLEESRRRGEVAVSRDAMSGGGGDGRHRVLVLQGPTLTRALLSYWKGAFAHAPRGLASASAALARAWGVMARALGGAARGGGRWWRWARVLQDARPARAGRAAPEPGAAVARGRAGAGVRRRRRRCRWARACSRRRWWRCWRG
jgi:hypothetical protein